MQFQMPEICLSSPSRYMHFFHGECLFCMFMMIDNIAAYICVCVCVKILMQSRDL
jgi:hypothetical protein